MEKTSLQFFIDNPLEWLSEIIDIIPVGIYRETLEGELIFCNRSFAEIFGCNSVQELIRSPIVNLYRDQRDRGHIIQTLIEKGHVEDLCIPFKKKTGAQLWCSLTAKAVFDEEGLFTFVDGVLADITAEFTSQPGGSRQLSKNQADRQKFQGVLEMAGGVAHLVNQPLMIINNLLYEVLTDLRPEDINYQRIRRINDQLKKLNEIAEKIRGIKQYKTMDYVGGLKIVDIDRAAVEHK